MKQCKSILIGMLLLGLLMSTFAPAKAAAVWFWEGTRNTGILAAPEDCPVILEKEVLTFDIPSFPMGDLKEPNYDYTASVTTEYTFFNPTQEEATLKVLLPKEERPSYYTEWGMHNAPEVPFTVTAGGEDISYTSSYIVTKGNELVDSREDFGRTAEGFVTDAFFTPDRKVTVYTYPIGRDYIQLDGDDYRYYGFDVPQVGEGTKVAFPGMEFYGTVYDYVTEENTPVFAMGRYGMEWMQIEPDLNLRVYFLGEPPTEPLHLRVFLKWNEQHSYFGDEILAEQYLAEYTVEETTLWELIDSLKPEDLHISQGDWYNAMVSKILWDEQTNPEGILTLHKGYWPWSIYDDYRDQWDWSMDFYGYDALYQMEETIDLRDTLVDCYAYTLRIGPGERLNHRIQVPLYPTIEYMDGSEYRYMYILTAEELRRDSSQTEIIIRTPYIMKYSTLTDFTREEDGYKLTMTGDYPADKLYFALQEGYKEEEKVISDDTSEDGTSHEDTAEAQPNNAPNREGEIVKKTTLKPWIFGTVMLLFAVGLALFITVRHKKKE